MEYEKPMNKKRGGNEKRKTVTDGDSDVKGWGE